MRFWLGQVADLPFRQLPTCLTPKLTPLQKKAHPSIACLVATIRLQDGPQALRAVQWPNQHCDPGPTRIFRMSQKKPAVGRFVGQVANLPGFLRQVGNLPHELTHKIPVNLCQVSHKIYAARAGMLARGLSLEVSWTSAKPDATPRSR